MASACGTATRSARSPPHSQPAHLAEAVRRQPGVGCAVAGAASPAGLAGTAGDLEGHDGKVAGRYPGHLVADFDDLDDALVAERVGPVKRVPAGQHGDVEIAGGDRDRAHERRVRAGERRLLRLRPADHGCAFEHESLHGASRLIVLGRAS